MALDFNGALEDITILGGSFTPPTVGSVSFWATPDDVTSQQRILGFVDAWEIKIRGASKWSNDLFANLTGILESVTSAVVGQLTHVVMTWNFSTTLLQIFLDGALDASNSNANDDPGSGTLLLAHRTGSPVGEHYDGDLEDIRIYNRELSLAEVQTIFAVRGVDGIVDGLLHRWLLNEQAPDVGASGAGVIKDLTGARNGTPNSIPDYSISNLRFRRRVA